MTLWDVIVVALLILCLIGSGASLIFLGIVNGKIRALRERLDRPDKPVPARAPYPAVTDGRVSRIKKLIGEHRARSVACASPQLAAVTERDRSEPRSAPAPAALTSRGEAMNE